MNRNLEFLTIAACSLMLAACGSSNDDDDTPPPAPANPPTRGSLIQSPPARTASLTPATIAAALTNQPGAEYLLDLIVAPKCGIDVHQVQYNTVDPAGAATTASAAMMIPTGSDPVCQGPRPIVAVRARHGRAALAEPREHHERRQSRRSVRCDGFHHAGLHPDRAQLHGLRHVCVDIQPVPQRRSRIERHGRCVDGGAQRAADQLRAVDYRFRQAVRHRLLAGRARCDGDAQGAAGSGRSDHCVGADVGSVRSRCVLRRRILRPGHAHDAAVPGLHVDGLSEGVRRRLRESGRRFRSALR